MLSGSKRPLHFFSQKKTRWSLLKGNKYTYDYLIVAPGIQLNWSDVKGLNDTIGKNCVTSNYSYKYAPYTYECLKNIKAGDTILFTAPQRQQNAVELRKK
jgi:hypothetical protein